MSWIQDTNSANLNLNRKVLQETTKKKKEEKRKPRKKGQKYSTTLMIKNSNSVGTSMNRSSPPNKKKV